MLFFEEGGKPESPEKTLGARTRTEQLYTTVSRKVVGKKRTRERLSEKAQSNTFRDCRMRFFTTTFLETAANVKTRAIYFIILIKKTDHTPKANSLTIKQRNVNPKLRKNYLLVLIRSQLRI